MVKVRVLRGVWLGRDCEPGEVLSVSESAAIDAIATGRVEQVLDEPAHAVQPADLSEPEQAAQTAPRRGRPRKIEVSE